MYGYSAVLGTTVGVAVELVLALVPCADTNRTSCDIASTRLRRATPYREGAIGEGEGGIREGEGLMNTRYGWVRSVWRLS